MKTKQELLSISFRILMYDTEEAYQKSIELLSNLNEDEQSTHAWNNLGVTHYEIGAFEESLFCFSKAIYLDGKNCVPFINRAELNVKLSKLKEAEFDFTKAIEMDPENPTLWRSRAYFYKSLNAFQQALYDFREAHKIEPDFPETKNQISEIESILDKKM